MPPKYPPIKNYLSGREDKDCEKNLVSDNGEELQEGFNSNHYQFRPSQQFTTSGNIRDGDNDEDKDFTFAVQIPASHNGINQNVRHPRMLAQYLQQTSASVAQYSYSLNVSTQSSSLHGNNASPQTSYLPVNQRLFPPTSLYQSHLRPSYSFLPQILTQDSQIDPLLLLHQRYHNHSINLSTPITQSQSSTYLRHQPPFIALAQHPPRGLSSNIYHITRQNQLPPPPPPPSPRTKMANKKATPGSSPSSSTSKANSRAGSPATSQQQPQVATTTPDDTAQKQTSDASSRVQAFLSKTDDQPAAVDDASHDSEEERRKKRNADVLASMRAQIKAAKDAKAKAKADKKREKEEAKAAKKTTPVPKPQQKTKTATPRKRKAATPIVVDDDSDDEDFQIGPLTIKRARTSRRATRRGPTRGRIVADVPAQYRPMPPPPPGMAHASTQTEDYLMTRRAPRSRAAITAAAEAADQAHNEQLDAALDALDRRRAAATTTTSSAVGIGRRLRSRGSAPPSSAPFSLGPRRPRQQVDPSDEEVLQSISTSTSILQDAQTLVSEATRAAAEPSSHSPSPSPDPAHPTRASLRRNILLTWPRDIMLPGFLFTNPADLDERKEAEKERNRVRKAAGLKGTNRSKLKNEFVNPERGRVQSEWFEAVEKIAREEREDEKGDGHGDGGDAGDEEESEQPGKAKGGKKAKRGGKRGGAAKKSKK